MTSARISPALLRQSLKLRAPPHGPTSQTRYYPPGMIGTETTLLRIAERRHPERWGAGELADEERIVWQAWGKTLGPVGVETKVSAICRRLSDSGQKDAAGAVYGRWLDICEAYDQLRHWLHGGELTAWADDETGVRHEVTAAAWGGIGAQDAIFEGVQFVAGAEIGPCVILIEEVALDRRLGETRRSPSRRAATDDDIKALRAAFDGQVPTIRQAEEWMRSNIPEVSRDSFRAKWRSHSPNLKTGPRGPRRPKLRG